MVSPLAGRTPKWQTKMKPASNAVAKRLFVRTLMTRVYTRPRDCKLKLSSVKPCLGCNLVTLGMMFFWVGSIAFRQRRFQSNVIAWICDVDAGRLFTSHHKTPPAAAASRRIASKEVDWLGPWWSILNSK